MAVNVNFIGRLGADCEIKVNSSGKSFVTFRVATNEYRGGKNETTWLNVADYTERGAKIAPHLKKGTMVSIHGIETVSIYQTQTGTSNISRDVISYSIDFVSSGNSATKGNGETEHSSEDSKMDCGTLKKRELDVTNLVDTNDGDDLPF